MLDTQVNIALKAIAKSAIRKLEIAEEPFWAIGSGQNSTPVCTKKLFAVDRLVYKQIIHTWLS